MENKKKCFKLIDLKYKYSYFSADSRIFYSHAIISDLIFILNIDVHLV